MISVLLDRNNFIINLLTAKSNDFKSLFVSAEHSRPYISIRIHFDLINSRMTSSDGCETWRMSSSDKHELDVAWIDIVSDNFLMLVGAKVLNRCYFTVVGLL